MQKHGLATFSLVGLIGGIALSACDGSTGLPGADGKNGMNGVNGVDGKASLVVTVDEQSGANCANGGKKIQTGLDANRNGMLEASEVTASTYVCNGPAGANGADGATGAKGADGAPGASGLTSLIRTAHEPAGASCTFGGVRTETGLDANKDGVLQDAEVNAAATQLLCQPWAAYSELPSLPVVTTVRSFALTASTDDGSARLGFMFTDPPYRQSLLDAGAIQNLGGVYDGANAYATYQIAGTSWQAYEGRTTPQTYAFSELVVVDNNSYYTTDYPSFGGLISVIQDGAKGAYALTPASATGKAHSIAVPPGSDSLYALAAQKTAGLTLSRFPLAQFGVTLPNYWTNLAVLDTAAATVTSPQLVVAGTKIAASYIQGTSAVFRATASPSTVAQASDVPVIGGCADATLADIAWDGTSLYVACVDSAHTLAVRRASLADLTAVTFETVTTKVGAGIDALDLEANASGVSLAVRQGTAVRVFAMVTDEVPAFEAVLPGSFDLASTSQGLVLAVCDMAGDRKLRTFVSW
jgi:hypothetical protein